jgi:hypothetical protein
VTDVSGDLASWVSAVGTIGATVAALYIAQRGWREAGAERLHRDAAQAQQIVMEQKGATLEITNFSEAPIMDLQIMNPIDQQQSVVCLARIRDADQRGFRVILGPKESAVVDVMSPDGEPADPGGSYTVTAIFTDAAGMDWQRDGNNPPAWIIQGRYAKGFTGQLPRRSARRIRRFIRSRYGPG